MVDKLEVRVLNDKHVGIPFAPGFARDYAALRNSDQNPFRGNRYYTEVADLREFGYQCVLHLGSKPGKVATHKLELIDVAKMSVAKIATEIEKVFSVDAFQLEITRIDAAADIERVPVWWFRDRMRIERKQWAREIGELREIKQAVIRVETLNFGNRPNFFRVYDKVAETKHQYKRALRRASHDQEPITFEEFAGFPENSIRTRIERQIAAGRIPESINTISKLQRQGASYNPFISIEIIDPGFSEPDPKDYPINVYLAGMQIRALILSNGWESTRKLLAQHTSGQLKRFLQTYRDFLPPAEPDVHLDMPAIFEVYRSSFRRQFQIPDPSLGPIPLGTEAGLQFQHTR